MTPELSKEVYVNHLKEFCIYHSGPYYKIKYVINSVKEIEPEPGEELIEEDSFLIFK